MEKLDLLMKLYQIENEMYKHEESQRVSVTNIILVITAAVLGIVGRDKSIVTSDLPITIFLLFIALFGVIFSPKFRFILDFHEEMENKYFSRALKTLSSEKESEAYQEIMNLRFGTWLRHSASHPFLTVLVPNWLLWTALSVVVVGIGLLLTLIAIYYPVVAAP